VILVISLLGLTALGVYSSGRFGIAITAQSAVSFVVPVSIMVLFWRAARSRLRAHEAAVRGGLGLERVTSRATEQFLAGVSHELVPHTERCDVKAEALVVAVDYQDFGADIKVAVPGIAVETDPGIFRQILHILIGNAIRHGGKRVAIWAVAEGGTMRISVSDDGPGLPEGAGTQVFQRYVDLAEEVRGPVRSGSGLAAIRGLAEQIGAELGYKRDPSWTHFSVSLPLAPTPAGSPADRVPLEAGAR
jgi:light-regulated signal transduction histidine kinase (bacteriophytochrome)